MTEQQDWVAAQHGPLEAVGYLDLDGRPAFKLALKVHQGRYYLYCGHFWHSGWSIVDVTHPRHPRLVNFVEGPPHTWTLQVTLKDDLLATSMEPVPADWGGDPSKHAEAGEGVLLWDISDPVNPVRLSHYGTGGGTHRNAFDEQGLLHLAARIPDHDGLTLVVLDVSDPVKPHEAARFAMPDQAAGTLQPAPFGIHGPSLRVGDLAYLPYGEYGLVVVDLSDLAAPRMVGQLNMKPPFASRIAAHTAQPLPGRGLLVLNSEALAEKCAEPVNYAGLVDVRDPANPQLMSLFPTPEPPPGADYTSFAERGGRFGPHNQSMELGHANTLYDENLCFLTYFNAGLRVYDTSVPHHVREVAYLIPKDPTRRYGVKPATLVTQVEDVLVDDRGVAYFTEKNSGLYIAQWNGLSR